MVPAGMERIVELLQMNGFVVTSAEWKGVLGFHTIRANFCPGEADRLRRVLAQVGVEVGIRRFSESIGRDDRFVVEREPGPTLAQLSSSYGRVEIATQTNGWVVLTGVSDEDLP
jgi:hypothetical protein